MSDFEETFLKVKGQPVTNMASADVNAVMEPPLGLRPREIADRERLLEIGDAIKRYLDAGNFWIPVEWVEEYNEILARVYDQSPTFMPSGNMVAHGKRVRIERSYTPEARADGH